MRRWPTRPPAPTMQARPTRTRRRTTRTTMSDVGAGSGVVVVDKPGGSTSHQVVGRLRRILRTRKIGPAGTLDPTATGALGCGDNRATRLLGHRMLGSTEYTATRRRGGCTV